MADTATSIWEAAQRGESCEFSPSLNKVRSFHSTAPPWGNLAVTKLVGGHEHNYVVLMFATSVKKPRGANTR
jgi:hypothetical protein